MIYRRSKDFTIYKKVRMAANKLKVKKTAAGVDYTTCPTLYKPEYCKQLIAHMGKGFSFQSFGADAKVSFKTLYNWEKEYPEFAQAKEDGLAANLKFMEKCGIEAITGGAKGVSAAIFCFTMKNRYPEIYKETVEVTHKVPENVTPEQAAAAYDKVSQK